MMACTGQGPSTRRVLHAVVELGARGVVAHDDGGAHLLGRGLKRLGGVGARGIVDPEVGVLRVRRQQVLDERRLACRSAAQISQLGLMMLQ